MKVTKDIQSLSDFKRNTSKLVKQVRETKRPVVLTVNGAAAVVVQDAESYDDLVARCERAEGAAILRERLDYVRKGGKLLAAEEVFSTISKRYGIKFD